MPDPERADLSSSWLASATYDATSQTLDVETRGGRRYTHVGVPQHAWDRLKNAESPGKTYQIEIKGRY